MEGNGIQFSVFSFQFSVFRNRHETRDMRHETRDTRHESFKSEVSSLESEVSSLKSQVSSLKSSENSKLKTENCFLLISFCLLLLTICHVAEPSSSTRGAFSFSGFATGVGTRAMGMNGAFAAVSDDSSSAYWNPAGLTSSWYKELFFAYANLYALDLITSSTLHISSPETSSGAISFGWTRLQYDFESWREDAFLLSYAKTLVGSNNPLAPFSKGESGGIPLNKGGSGGLFSLSCGVTLKYLRQTSKLDITPPPESETEGGGSAGVSPALSSPIFCNSKGMGLDVGLLARIRAKDGRNLFSLGIAAQDIPTVIKWNSGDLETRERIPYRYKIGCSSEPLPRLTVALDLAGEQTVRFKEIHLGMEHWIFPAKWSLPISEKNMAIRGGVAKELQSSGRMTFAGGLGVRWSSWQLDYAYLMDNNGLGDTRNRFSVSVRF